jgi:transposase
MATSVKRIGDGWRIPDAFWVRLEPLLPKRKRRRRYPGRKPLPWRQVIDGIFYVLRTGCQWKAAPAEFGSGSSLHRYFQRLVAKGIFAQLWKLALEEYDELEGIQWEWQSIDGAMTKAPLGGEKNRAESDRSGQARNQAVVAYRWRRRPAGSGRQRCQHA